MVGYVFRQRSLAWLVAFDKIVTFCFCGLTQIPHPKYTSTIQFMYGKFEKKTENSEITMTNDMKIILKKKEKKKNGYEKKKILSTDDDKCE